MGQSDQPPQKRLDPLYHAIQSFLYEAPIRTRTAPHVRDLIDLKRWMMVVIFALLPCIVMAVWNTGVQKYVYGSFDFELMQRYVEASSSLKGYFDFTFTKGRALPILMAGLGAFLPVMLISYIVGGFWELLFAIIRRHDVSEGFLVSGMLFALILPSTIPYWMVAVGVSLGIVVGKEIFGGTGMNILNPALVCRAFLFFAFPTKMTGAIWVGTNPTQIQHSLVKINQEANLPDGYTQASPLNLFNVSSEIKRIHIDAIAATSDSVTTPTIKKQYKLWSQVEDIKTPYGALSQKEKRRFITTPLSEKGLGLPPELYSEAVRFSHLQYGYGTLTNGNFFWGNRIGSFGETSILACALGALLLIITGVGSWRVMLAVIVGAFGCALLFQAGAHLIGPHGGAFNPAKFAFPAYKHFLLGSLAFGLVFMATDPVSSPDMNRGRIFYGLLVGALVILIRVINPAFPEGVMLAILFGNVFAPFFDHIALNSLRSRRGKKDI